MICFAYSFPRPFGYPWLARMVLIILLASFVGCVSYVAKIVCRTTGWRWRESEKGQDLGWRKIQVQFCPHSWDTAHEIRQQDNRRHYYSPAMPANAGRTAGKKALKTCDRGVRSGGGCSFGYESDTSRGNVQRNNCRLQFYRHKSMMRPTSDEYDNQLHERMPCGYAYTQFAPFRSLHSSSVALSHSQI